MVLWRAGQSNARSDYSILAAWLLSENSAPQRGGADAQVLLEIAYLGDLSVGQINPRRVVDLSFLETDFHKRLDRRFGFLGDLPSDLVKASHGSVAENLRRSDVFHIASYVRVSSRTRCQKSTDSLPDIGELSKRQNITLHVAIAMPSVMYQYFTLLI